MRRAARRAVLLAALAATPLRAAVPCAAFGNVETRTVRIGSEARAVVVEQGALSPPACTNVVTLSSVEGGRRTLLRTFDGMRSQATVFTADRAQWIAVASSQPSPTMEWTGFQLFLVRGAAVQAVTLPARASCHGVALPEIGEMVGHGGYGIAGNRVTLDAPLTLLGGVVHLRATLEPHAGARGGSLALASCELAQADDACGIDGGTRARSQLALPDLDGDGRADTALLDPRDEDIHPHPRDVEVWLSHHGCARFAGVLRGGTRLMARSRRHHGLPDLSSVAGIDEIESRLVVATFDGRLYRVASAPVTPASDVTGVVLAPGGEQTLQIRTTSAGGKRHRRTLDLGALVSTSDLRATVGPMQRFVLLGQDTEKGRTRAALDVCGPASRVGGSAYCGGGQECNLLWLDLVGEDLVAARSYLTQSCRTGIETGEQRCVAQPGGLRCRYRELTPPNRRGDPDHDVDLWLPLRGTGEPALRRRPASP